MILEPRNSRPQERPLEVAMADQIPAEPRAGTWNLGVEIGWGLVVWNLPVSLVSPVSSVTLNRRASETAKFQIPFSKAFGLGTWNLPLVRSDSERMYWIITSWKPASGTWNLESDLAFHFRTVFFHLEATSQIPEFRSSGVPVFQSCEGQVWQKLPCPRLFTLISSLGMWNLELGTWELA